MNEFEPKDVSIREQIVSDIPAHEVLLSFNDDCQGEAFCDWWHTIGINAFTEWCISNKDNY
jgi:hypothetical protein